MKNKGMKKLLSKVQKSGVVNYTRTHWSSYVYKWSWIWRAGAVLGEFQDITITPLANPLTSTTCPLLLITVLLHSMTFYLYSAELSILFSNILSLSQQISPRVYKSIHLYLFLTLDHYKYIYEEAECRLVKLYYRFISRTGLDVQ